MGRFNRCDWRKTPRSVLLFCRRIHVECLCARPPVSPLQHFVAVATPRLYCPPSLLPLSCLILPQDQPPSPCLPRWLLGSSASCPGWHELMITAEASQSRLIHYIFLAGLQQVLHCFWHLMHSTLPRLSTANTPNPPSHPPLFAAFHNIYIIYGTAGAQPYVKIQYLTATCAAVVFFFSTIKRI